MGVLVQFVPRAELEANDNLKEFIRLCRDELTKFGSDLRWSDWHWKGGGNFTKIGVRARGVKVSDLLADAFVEFAKAYFRYQQAHRPTKGRNEMRALRVIEAALLQLGKSPIITELNQTVLDHAAAIAREHYSGGTAYHCGRELERLARFVTSKHLVPTSIATWRNPIGKPSDMRIQTGPVAKELRDNKLPAPECLDALAEIFSNCPTAPKDIFTTSVFAMSMCAPSRGTELLLSPADLEWEEKDSQGEVRYGWRFFSGKGFEGDIKWIPSVMVPIAKEAIRRIRELTEEPRRLARWLETEPSRFFRHKDCPDVADDQPLSCEQTCAALGTTRIALLGLSEKQGAHTLNSLWEWARARLPRKFPWIEKKIGLKYSNALFCMNRNMLHAARGTNPVALWAPVLGTFDHDLGPRRGVEYHKSIFARWGYAPSLKLTSHQARHLLSTISERGGLSEDQAAKWAGRADPKQNRVYNHRSELEKVAAAEAIDPALILFGPAGIVPLNEPISRSELTVVERGPAHVTEFGVCVHDWVISPCEKFRECTNCQEHVFVKGEDECLKRIKEKLAQVEIDFAKAEEALQSGFAGADRWYESHQREVARLRDLIQILEDKGIPDGSQIKLRGGDFSHLRRVIASKGSAQLLESATAKGLMIDAARRLGEGQWQST
jgi:hypothetical protein